MFETIGWSFLGQVYLFQRVELLGIAAWIGW